MQTSESNVILIVDDTPTNLEVLSEALADVGFEVAVAISGESAIQQIEYELPNLILLDVMMPGIDGFETCYRLKQNPLTKDIPVIFMTALCDTVDKVKGLSLGAVDYITKPFQQAEVIARIQTQMKLQKLTATLEKQNICLKQEIAERTAAEVALQQLTQELELRVVERTQELSQALHNLKVAQVQLVQTEKLTALGQLVAGIAHEINNPVNFVRANLCHISHYTQGLLELVKLYQNHCPSSNPNILAKAEEIDFEYLTEDLPKILSSMQVGTGRIRDIVQSLRNFSRHDEAEIKVVNIHDGLESTMALLGNRLKRQSNHQQIQVVKKYGDLPKVECYAGKINQVFMSVLNNAIEALEETINTGSQSSTTSPTISINTELLQDNSIAIRISDNGPGMSEDVKRRLFDPFFTTKPIGKGTGLGMSVSYQIVTELHGGSLQCISNPGKGAEFLIKIPIQQQKQVDTQWRQSQNFNKSITYKSPVTIGAC